MSLRDAQVLAVSTIKLSVGSAARACAQVRKVLGEAMDRFGRLDGVVNCTGNMTMKPAHLTGEEEFMEGLRINALSSFNILSAAVRPPPPCRSALPACTCAACQLPCQAHVLSWCII